MFARSKRGDRLGRDVLAKAIKGTEISVFVGVMAALTATLIGTLLDLPLEWAHTFGIEQRFDGRPTPEEQAREAAFEALTYNRGERAEQLLVSLGNSWFPGVKRMAQAALRKRREHIFGEHHGRH